MDEPAAYLGPAYRSCLWCDAFDGRNSGIGRVGACFERFSIGVDLRECLLRGALTVEQVKAEDDDCDTDIGRRGAVFVRDGAPEEPPDRQEVGDGDDPCGGDAVQQAVVEQVGQATAGDSEGDIGEDRVDLDVNRVRPEQGDRKDHETGETELGGGKADGVKAGELGFGEDGGDRISGAGQGDEEDAHSVRVDGADCNCVGSVGVDDQNDAEEAEQYAGDGAAFGFLLHEAEAEQQRPDGGRGIDEGGDAAGDGALADREEDEGDRVIE